MPGSGRKSIEGGGVGRGRGIGNGLGGSTNRFAAYVQSLREAGLDVVFLVDMTGSMIWVLDGTTYPDSPSSKLPLLATSTTDPEVVHDLRS